MTAIPALVVRDFAPPPTLLNKTDPASEVLCSHPSAHLVANTKSNGARSYFLQCWTCGQTGREIKHAMLSPACRDAAPPRRDDSDATIRHHREYARRRYLSRFTERRDDALGSFRRTHAVQTAPTNEAWQRMRRYVFARSGHRCEAYLPGCQGRASQVHHRRYNVTTDNEHLGGEPAWDLAAVCDSCHAFIHHHA